jgi:hypothetical protein
MNEDLWTRLVADFQQVAESFSNNESVLRSLTLKKGVGGDLPSWRVSLWVGGNGKEQ